MSRPPALALLLLCGCETDLPGDVVGAYNVAWTLEENGCGQSARLLADGHSRAIELREDAPRGYWRAAGVPPIQGSYEAGEFRFATTSTFDLGSMDAGTAGCLVARDELLTGRIETVESDSDERGDGGAKDAATRLRGEHAMSFTPHPEGRCANVQGPIGDFAQLPCRALYEIAGSERKRFD